MTLAASQIQISRTGKKKLVNSPEQYCGCVGMDEAWIGWVGEGHTVTVCVGWTVDAGLSWHFGSVEKSSEILSEKGHKNVKLKFPNIQSILLA